MEYTLVKEKNKIKGFVYQKKDGSFWFAFGKPSQMARHYASEDHKNEVVCTAFDW